MLYLKEKIKLQKHIKKTYALLLSEETMEKGEKVIVTISIASFLIHLLLIVANNLDIINLGNEKVFISPIGAIYTPFSFILIYEVYLLVYYLPKSITNYIGKQYEIITLIIIRRLFKDLSELELSSNWFDIKEDLIFTYDILASLLLFGLIYLFYKFNSDMKRLKKRTKDEPPILGFIRKKQAIALILVPTFLLLAIYSLANWIHEVFYLSVSGSKVEGMNDIFFNEFFTVLILTDVLLLLLSFLHTSEFRTVIRNSGFIISTILIRLSFGVEGLVNTALIVIAVLFGVLILATHNFYEKLIIDDPETDP